MNKRVLFILLALVPAIAFGYPKPKGYVSDFAGAFDNPSALEHRISEYHKATKHEIAVVTIKTLDGVSIEEYAHGLFNEWGIGKKGDNDGVLILIAVQDHKTRIEVGYGFEGRLNDSECGRIIRNDMIPEFKQNHFDRGVDNALTSIFDRIGAN